jgi:uncharacterized protein
MKRSNAPLPLVRANAPSANGGAQPPEVESEGRDLAAGDFSSWMTEMKEALRGRRASDVPCHGCTACCTSSQFIHIGPDETETLSRVPAELKFPAPGMPGGHVLLGYDERGHCPMLVDGRCSIYEHRPRTCRTYDCRIFPAAGLVIEDDKVFIARQTQRWEFSFSSEPARVQHAAIRAAASFLRAHAGELPEETAPTNTTQLAVQALQVHDVFLQPDGRTGHPNVVEPAIDVVGAALMQLRTVTAVDEKAKRRRRAGRRK